MRRAVQSPAPLRATSCARHPPSSAGSARAHRRRPPPCLSITPDPDDPDRRDHGEARGCGVAGLPGPVAGLAGPAVGPRPPRRRRACWPRSVSSTVSCPPTSRTRATRPAWGSPSRRSSTTGRARSSSVGFRTSTAGSSTSKRCRRSSWTRPRRPRTGRSGTNAGFDPSAPRGGAPERLGHQRTRRIDDHPAAGPGPTAPGGRRRPAPIATCARSRR